MRGVIVATTLIALGACSSQPEPVVRATETPSAGPTRSAPPSPSPTPTPSPTPVPMLVRYVAIGASDTVGVGATMPENGSWPARLAAKLPAGSEYVNLGVSGSLASQARTEQLPRAIPARPTLVTIWLAVNDLNALVPPPAYAEVLASIVDPLVAGTEARIFIGNVPDLRAVPAYAAADPQILLAQVAAYNDVIARLAARHGNRVVVVDLFRGSAELTTRFTVSADGFHPSDEGYALIADRFLEAMRSAGTPMR